MVPLKLPAFNYTIKRKADKTYILDLVRRKYLLLTSEEWVRQHMLNYLINCLFYPRGLCCLEKHIQCTGGYYRPDIIFCDPFGVAKMIIECKAVNLNCSYTTLGQIMKYSRQLPVKVLVVTNGITHFCWKLDPTTHQFQAMETIPTYQEFVII